MSDVKAKVLVVDDDPGILKQLKWSLLDFEVITANNRESALTQMRLHAPAVVTLDLGLPPDPTNASEGLETLCGILALFPHTKIIVLTGNDDRTNALKAIDLGATDFFQKPVMPEMLTHFIHRALKIHHLEDENRRLSQFSPVLNNITGSSLVMQRVFKMVDRIAKNNITTLLLGESGTGKEVLATAIHQQSDRKDQAFVAINCASIPENLLESELFGYEKGAFTGANKQTIGKIEYADGGTLFLDEIGDMPLALQAKMLRFLQERKIERVGGRTEIPVDIRVICATHRDLSSMIKSHDFREDLFYRINEICINIPPLRERDSDVIILAKTFLSQYNSELDTKIKGFTANALRALASYPWPGNIRELQNKIKSAVIMSDNNYIDTVDLGIDEEEENSKIELLREIRAQAEIKAIIKAYEICGCNMSKTSEQLGVTRPTLYSLIEKYQIGDLLPSRSS